MKGKWKFYLPDDELRHYPDLSPPTLEKNTNTLKSLVFLIMPNYFSDIPASF